MCTKPNTKRSTKPYGPEALWRVVDLTRGRVTGHVFAPNETQAKRRAGKCGFGHRWGLYAVLVGA